MEGLAAAHPVGRILQQKDGAGGCPFLTHQDRPLSKTRCARDWLTPIPLGGSYMRNCGTSSRLEGPRPIPSMLESFACLLGATRASFSCGGGGIRTPGTLRYVGFQDRCIQPLCHPSGRLDAFGQCDAKLRRGLRPRGIPRFLTHPQEQTPQASPSPSLRRAAMSAMSANSVANVW